MLFMTRILSSFFLILAVQQAPTVYRCTSLPSSDLIILTKDAAGANGVVQDPSGHAPDLCDPASVEFVANSPRARSTSFDT
ncbi:hypothetical protein Hypma_002505 [Hypsizygus marmoreus]|uniref:Uncharacterized protein n=1 Tax=Hypsizygus marmoreus TaxID=39966 RepID=A0A369J4H2_HYPMA|nr:hypothetical protein Hypma_002505 [Hypsizygus marmoreus]